MKYNLNYHPRCIILLLACLGLPLTALATDTGSVLPNGNTADGSGVLISRTTGIANSGFGFQSLYHDNSGSYNTATGYRALFNDTTGYSNTADGYEALYSDTTGIRNTAIGNGTLLHNNANFNTAIGWAALYSNTTGTDNTATGYQALYSNTTGSYNTANGNYALFRNTTGGSNTATGFQALYNNTTISGNAGAFNTATGYQALLSNTTGNSNVAVGDQALFSSTTGNGNTAIGVGALEGNTTGGGNIAMGFLAGVSLTAESNNIDIDNSGIAGESGTIRIGSNGLQTRAFIWGISGVNEGGTISAVYINSDGQLGTQPPSSSRRFKKEIKPMEQASEAILSLKPVTFHYKSDKAGTPQFGLIAEEVAKINPDLVVRDENGEIYTVRYDAVNAMLLNEFLKEHRKVEEQNRRLAAQEANAHEQIAINAELRSTIAQQQKAMQLVAARLDQHDREFQNVNTRFGLMKDGQRLADSNR